MKSQKVQYNWRCIYLWICLLCMADVQAQIFNKDSILSSLKEKDKSFNAAEDYAQTFEGYDVDTKNPGHVNLGVQVAQDFMAMSSNHSSVIETLNYDSYYRQRIDFMLSSALPERTNLYAILSCSVTGMSETSFSILNLEVEHYLKGDHVKFRLGRLISKLSESQFYGRIALGDNAAHTFGRTPFVNDAFEMDINLKDMGLPVFIVGLKNSYKPVNISGVYVGAHHRFKESFQTYLLLSATRQFARTLARVPGYEGGNRWYYSYEAEVAWKRPEYCLFANIGGYIDYIGALPHSSGKYDMVKHYMPIVKDTRHSMRETFIPAIGVRLRPAKLWDALKFVPMAGFEAEAVGLGHKEQTTLNMYGYVKFNLTNRLILSYACNPQFVWDKRTSPEYDMLSGTTHYVRLSLTVGKPARMMM